MKLANPPERWLCFRDGDEIPLAENVFCAGNFSPCPAYMKDGELLAPFWSLTALSLWCISPSLTLMYQTGFLTALLAWLNKALLNSHFPIGSWLDFAFLSSITSPIPSRSTLSAGIVSCYHSGLALQCLCSSHMEEQDFQTDKIKILLVTQTPSSVPQCHTIHPCLCLAQTAAPKLFPTVPNDPSRACCGKYALTYLHPSIFLRQAVFFSPLYHIQYSYIISWALNLSQVSSFLFFPALLKFLQCSHLSHHSFQPWYFHCHHFWCHSHAWNVLIFLIFLLSMQPKMTFCLSQGISSIIFMIIH